MSQKPGQQIVAMYPAISAMKMQREIMGIRPIDQPELITELEIEAGERRLFGDQWFDINYKIDPEATIKLIKKMSRMDLEEFR